MQPATNEAPSRGDDSRSYQVVARRFRPRHFQEVVGQEAILHGLKSALAAGRIPHAFLFSGSRGVGKTTLARILARALNCEATSRPTAEPCDRCAACTSILSGHNPDVVEIDAASHNLVDDVRDLRDRVGFVSMGSRYKVYILDEVHMLTRSAFNAFLKTLEEPPPNVVFVLATTELHKVPETIRSRCQVLHFRQVGEDDIASRLRDICRQESVPLPDDVLAEIAASSRGGMRDAETALERVLPVAVEQGSAFDLAAYRQLVHRLGLDRVVEVVGALVQGDAAPALHMVGDMESTGVDEREALGEVLEVLRALLLLRVDGPETVLVPHKGELRRALADLAQGTATERLDAMIQAGLLGRERIRKLDDRRLVLEVTLLRMAAAGSLPLLADLVRAVREGAEVPFAASPSAAPGAGAKAAPAISSRAATSQARDVAKSGAPASAGSPLPSASASAPVAASPLSASPSLAGLGPAAPIKALLLQRLGREKPLLVHTLEQCEVFGPEVAAGGKEVVRLELRTERKMHHDRLAADGVRQLLRGMLREALGRDVELQVGVGAPPPAAAAPAPGPASPSGTAAPSPAPADVAAANTPSTGAPSTGAAAKGPPSTGAPHARGASSSVRKVMERFDAQILGVDDAPPSD